MSKKNIASFSFFLLKKNLYFVWWNTFYVMVGPVRQCSINRCLPLSPRTFFSLLRLCHVEWVQILWSFFIRQSQTPSLSLSLSSFLISSIYVNTWRTLTGLVGSENATIGLMRSNVNVYLRKLWIVSEVDFEVIAKKKIPVYFTCMNMIGELRELRNSWLLRVWKTCNPEKSQGFILKCDL